MVEDYPDCACGCGRPLYLTSSKYAIRGCRQRAVRGKRAADAVLNPPTGGINVRTDLLAKLVNEHAVLSPGEELQLGETIEQAKREIYRRRGGADRDFQLACDRGEVQP